MGTWEWRLYCGGERGTTRDLGPGCLVMKDGGVLGID